MASWTGLLFLATISVILLDLTEGLTCYHCTENRSGPGFRRRSAQCNNSGVGVNFEGVAGAKGRSPPKKCRGYNATNWPTEDCDGGCSVLRTTGCNDAGTFADITHRQCLSAEDLGGTGDQNCVDYTDVQRPSLEEKGFNSVWAKLCVCKEDKCNIDYIESEWGNTQFDCRCGGGTESVASPGGAWGMIQLGLGAVGVVRVTATWSGF